MKVLICLEFGRSWKWLGIVGAVLFCACASSASGEVTADFYVATSGDDRWSGKLAEANATRTDGPFATLQRARDAIRQLRAQDGYRPRPLTVMVRGGKYYLEQALTFGPQDSGTRPARITYTAYPGEEPILSGGCPISGFKPYKGNILQCEVTRSIGGKWLFRQLFVDGKRQIRARFPNVDPRDPLHGGYLQMEDVVDEINTTTFRYNSDKFPRRWAKPTQGELYAWDRYNWCYTFRIPVMGIDYDNGIMRLAHGPKSFDVFPWYFRTSFAQNRYFVENLLEELDQPGEWCLDTDTGILYYWPSVQKVSQANVVAPVLGRLIDIRAEFLTFSGFTITETTTGNSSHPTGVRGVGAMFGTVGWSYCGDGIHLQRAKHCIIEDNRFVALGGNGIYLENHNFRNIIRRNIVSQCGANGVAMAGSRLLHIPYQAEDGYLSPGPEPPSPSANQVTDNEIHHCGVFDKAAAGVFMGRSNGNTIAHNEIHHLPHHGVNFGSDGYGRNFLEYNRIHHVCQETLDTGAVNVWMETPLESERSGHVIRNNFISDVGWSEGSPLYMGIYLDNEASNCFVQGNIIVRCPVGIMLKGKNNVVENNIISAERILMWLHPSWAFDWWPINTRLKKNIFFCKELDNTPYFVKNHGSDFKSLQRAVGQCDDNLYYHAGGQVLFAPTNDQSGLSLQDWRTITGFDNHSVNTDPFFVDPANDNYGLHPHSPAFRLGFQQIDMKKVGIRVKIK